MTFNFLDTLYSDIMKMISNIVVKREDYARQNETTASIRSYELYLACVNGSREFYNFASFNIDILTTYLDSSIVAECAADPNKIPTEFRADIVEAQAQYVISTYVETNAYYRILNGLPPYGSTSYIYVTGRDDIDPTIPIHLLTDDQIAHITADGTLDTLKAQYTTAEYLDYLGTNRIAIITARAARPFQILRLGSPSSMRTANMFRAEYYKARRYVMATMYNRTLFTDTTLYDPIMGMIILAMAIRNTMVPNEKEYLNFEEMLNAILQSYDFLQYFEKFPFTIKRNLVLALNSILSVKGTDGVLIDVCKLFSFDDFTANRYYMIKTPAKDIEGNIIFDPDPNKAYNLNFIKADIQNHNIDYSTDNWISYDSVTGNDYLWQITPEEKTELLTQDFNLMMSKYIDIEAAYDVTYLTFELCCFTNLLIHSRDELSKITCTNMYSSNGYSTVFTMIMFWLTCMARRSNYDGNIIYDPEDISEIMQFNYTDIEEQLNAVLTQYSDHMYVDDTLVPGYSTDLDKPVGYINQNDAISIYHNNRELYLQILELMNTTEDVNQYISLSKLKNLLYFAASEETVFTMTNGQPASTYYEMLSDIDPLLAAKVDSITDDSDLNNLTLYILEKLEEVFNSDELRYLFLNTPSAYGSLLSDYLETAINVFKASSVQLHSINVYFYLGDHDPVRIIDDQSSDEKTRVDDIVEITDEVSTHETIYINDYVGIVDKPYDN